MGDLGSIPCEQGGLYQERSVGAEVKADTEDPGCLHALNPHLQGMLSLSSATLSAAFPGLVASKIPFHRCIFYKAQGRAATDMKDFSQFHRDEGGGTGSVQLYQVYQLCWVCAIIY